MTRKEFEQLVAEGVTRLPEQFRTKIKNVGFLVEDEPSAAVRKEVGLCSDETLLGFYRGIPRTARGGEYGVGPTLPDVIIIYRKPTEEEARYRVERDITNQALIQTRIIAKSDSRLFREPRCLHRGKSAMIRSAIQEVVADTVWHEVAHYFGFDEEAVARRETEREMNESKVRRGEVKILRP